MQNKRKRRVSEGLSSRGIAKDRLHEMPTWSAHYPQKAVPSQEDSPEQHPRRGLIPGVAAGEEGLPSRKTTKVADHSTGQVELQPSTT